MIWMGVSIFLPLAWIVAAIATKERLENTILGTLVIIVILAFIGAVLKDVFGWEG